MEELAFAEAVYRAAPAMPLDRLVATGSPAAAMLKKAITNVGWSCPIDVDGLFLQGFAQASLLNELNDLHHTEM